MPTSIEKKEVQVESGIWTSVPKFLAINLMIATILMFVFCPSCLLSWEELISVREDFMFSFLISSVLSFGGSRVENFFEPRISWIKQPVKRLILTIVTYMIYCFIASFIVAFFISWFYGYFTLADAQWMYLVQFTKQPMIIAFIFMSLFTTRSWLLEWKKSATEAEKLRTEMLASQYQSLKDQQPPFPVQFTKRTFQSSIWGCRSLSCIYSKAFKNLPIRPRSTARRIGRIGKRVGLC